MPAALRSTPAGDVAISGLRCPRSPGRCGHPVRRRMPATPRARESAPEPVDRVSPWYRVPGRALRGFAGRTGNRGPPREAAAEPASAGEGELPPACGATQGVGPGVDARHQDRVRASLSPPAGCPRVSGCPEGAAGRPGRATRGGAGCARPGLRQGARRRTGCPWRPPEYSRRRPGWKARQINPNTRRPIANRNAAIKPSDHRMVLSSARRSAR